MTWDADGWLRRLATARVNGDGFRELRQEVWRATLAIAARGEYAVDGRRVALDDHGEGSEEWEGATFHDDTIGLEPRKSAGNVSGSSRIEVLNADCLDVAAELRSEGLDVAVLNMANRRTPGGGVFGGAGAQEENIFRRTTLFRSLFRFADVGASVGVRRDPEVRSYPLDRTSGAIHSRRATVFRSSEQTGYRLLAEPWSVAVLTMPAINRPTLRWDSSGLAWLADPMARAMRMKIRGLLALAAHHGHDALVLGAWGCGAFCNPPQHVAQLFAEELRAERVRRAFRVVAFAVFDDHNAGRAHNPRGNFAPFREALHDLGGRDCFR